MKLNSYLTFNGNCLEAMEFYKECFGGEFIEKHTVGESQPQVPDNVKNLIMHIEFKALGNTIMASDTLPGQEVVIGSNISMSISMKDENKMRGIFEKMSVGGKMAAPLEKTYWGAVFGMFVDKFGINWMFNCPKEVEATETK